MDPMSGFSPARQSPVDKVRGAVVRDDLLASDSVCRAWFGPAALGAAIGGAVLGVLGDWFLTGTPALGYLLFVALVVVTVATVGLRAGVQWYGGARLYLAAALVFAACMAWRDSAVLRALNLGISVLFLALAAYEGCDGRNRAVHLSQMAFGVVAAALNTAFGAALLLFREIPWDRHPRRFATPAGGRVLARNSHRAPVAAGLRRALHVGGCRLCPKRECGVRPRYPGGCAPCILRICHRLAGGGFPASPVPRGQHPRPRSPVPDPSPIGHCRGGDRPGQPRRSVHRFRCEPTPLPFRRRAIPRAGCRA